MIEKATETFWKNLKGLGFIDPAQISKWQDVASAPGATWLQLCQAIQQDSRLTSTHLNLLTSEHPATPVLVGSLLVQRSILHPLNWEAYEAVHVKLEKEWRVILLPDANDNSLASSVVERARRIAQVDDPHVTRIVDLETYGSRYAMILPVVRGERLSQIWGAAQANLDWELVAKQLVATLRRVHLAGFDVGSLDPVNVHFDQEQQALQLDDLVCSPWINDDVIPNGLDAKEEGVIVSFRAQRAGFLRTHMPSTAATEQARDWLECAAWLHFVGAQLASAKAIDRSDELAERFQASAAELVAIHQGTDTDFSLWYARWFEPKTETTRWNLGSSISDENANPWGNISEPLAPTAATVDQEPTIELAEDKISVRANDAPLPAFPNIVVAAKSEPAADRSKTAEGSAPQTQKQTPKPGSLANKQAAKREVEKRRRMVMAIAIITPLPICLLVVLAMYLLQPASETVPDLANQPANQTELPDADLPDAELPNTELTDGDLSSKADRESKSPSLVQGNKSTDLPVRPTLETDVTSPIAKTDAGSPTKATDPADDDELLTDLVPPPVENDSTDSVALPEANAALPTPLPEKDSTTATETDSAAVTESGPTTRPAEDGFIAYTHVPSELDVVGAWRELLKGNSTSGTTQTVQLGQLNRITAKRTLLEINSSEANIGSIFRIVVKSADDPSVVQQWELQRNNAGEPKPLAWIQTTTDGQLQVVLPPVAETEWNNAEDLRLEFYFGDRDVSHWLALGKGPRPKIGPASTPVASPVAANSGDRSEVTANPPTDENPDPANATDDGKMAASNVANAPIPDLTFDPKSATSKGWFQDTPGFAREGSEWRFQLAGKPLKKLDREHPLWKAFRVRAKEEVYFMDELLDTGSIVLMVTAETGNRTRLEGRLQLLTPNGLRPLKKDSGAEAATEAEQFKQALKLQYDQLKSTRAKPGEGDLKQAELNRLDAMMKDMDRYKKALEFVVQNNDALLEKGLAFGLVQVVDGQEEVLLKSQSFTSSDSTEK